MPQRRYAAELSAQWTMGNEPIQGNERATYIALVRLICVTTGSPNGREPHGDRAPVVVRSRESRLHGEGGQVSSMTLTRRCARCATPKLS